MTEESRKLIDDNIKIFTQDLDRSAVLVILKSKDVFSDSQIDMVNECFVDQFSFIIFNQC